MKLWELYQEESDSTVTHNGHTYSVNKLLRYAEDIDVEEFDVADLKWILKHDSLDLERVKAKQIKHPILVTKLGEKLVVLDGIHRLAKAFILDRAHIRGKYIDHEILKKSRLD